MRVESVGLPLRFILSGLVALVLAIAALAFWPDLAAAYHYNQWVVAVTHLFTLGWLSSVVMGAMYQLVPVALETRLYSARLAGIHFWVHLAGWCGMVAMLWVWNVHWLPLFGSVFVLSVALFAYNIGRTLHGIPSWNVVAVGITSAIAWLAIAVLAGLYIAFAKHFGISLLDPLAQMHAHAHLGGVGFFVMMLVAVSYKLVPMFSLSEIQSRRRAYASVFLINVGLLGAAVAVLFGSPWKTIFAATIVAGLAFHGVEITAILRARKRRQVDLPLKQFLAALSLLVPTSVCALVLSWPGLPVSELTTQLETVYAVLALAGVLTLAIIGMLYKIVPFLVWYFAYSRHIGRARVPALADLSSTQLQAVGFALFVPGLLVLACGSLLSSEAAVRCGALLMLASLGAFVGNVIAMLLHLRRPRLQPLTRLRVS